MTSHNKNMHRKSFSIHRQSLEKSKKAQGTKTILLQADGRCSHYQRWLTGLSFAC
uniref:PH domain-containing protein n=1 Tax=Rhizophora mucronata TaxID=61149 RepID=A0A2P2NDD7_RHIMU